jgi:hypothetical protein
LSELFLVGGSASRIYLPMWIVAMPDAAGTLFDDLGATLQSGPSEKRVAMFGKSAR